MNDRRIPLEKEEPKYKKKSKARGLSRSKHKHKYIPVLLHRPWKNRITSETIELVSVYKVCQVCGRIDYILRGEEWYDTEYEYQGRYRISKDRLSKKALALPKWYTHDYFDKFAYEGELI